MMYFADPREKINHKKKKNTMGRIPDSLISAYARERLLLSFRSNWPSRSDRQAPAALPPALWQKTLAAAEGQR